MKKWQKKAAAFFILSCLLFCFSNETNAGIIGEKCKVVLHTTKNIPQITLNFGKEIWDTRGGVLFLRNPKTVAHDPTRWGGFVTTYERKQRKGIRKILWNTFLALPRGLGWIFLGGSNNRLSTFEGFYRNLIQKPVLYLTKTSTGERKEPKGYIKFVLGATYALGFWTYALRPAISAAQEWTQMKTVEVKINQQTEKYSKIYDQLIDADFAYQEIKIALASQKIDRESARQTAMVISMAHDQYFSYLEALQGIRTIETEMQLLENPLFAHLKPIIAEGVQPTEGYIVPLSSQGFLSEAKIMRLFEVNHTYQLKRQLISEMLNEPVRFDSLSTSNLKNVISEMTQSYFFRRLTDLYHQKKITKNQYQSLLQENAYWEATFAEWATIGVQKLRTVGNNFTDIPLTLADIQEEIIASLSP